MCSSTIMPNRMYVAATMGQPFQRERVVRMLPSADLAIAHRANGWPRV